MLFYLHDVYPFPLHPQTWEREASLREGGVRILLILEWRQAGEVLKKFRKYSKTSPLRNICLVGSSTKLGPRTKPERAKLIRRHPKVIQKGLRRLALYITPP